MTVAPNYHSELYELAGAQCEGTMVADQVARLEELVLGDGRLRRMYILYMHVHACAERRGAGGKGRGMAGLPAIDLSVSTGAAVEHPVGAAVELPLQPEPRTPSPEPPFPTLSTTNYPLPTPFVGSWAFSYMVATVIMGVMLLVFWAMKVTHHQHIAEAPAQSAPSEAMPEMVFVGRITGMVDVKWSDDPHYLPPPDFAHVPLERKYILSSGLLEITYDSGAKVILEGPCTYEVESTAGGYLALGKLTAKVASGQWPVASAKPQAANQKSPSSFILHPSSLFFVRTPTAIITDLGTEFGVEVNKAGTSKTHVFQGRVEMRLADGGRGEPLTIQLGVGESGQVEHGADGRGPTLLRGAADAAGFVRVGQLAKLAEQLHPTPLCRWQAWSKELRKRDDLLAYYDFQRDESDRLVLRNRAATGKQFDGRIESPAWVSGRFPGKHALRFGWAGNGVRVNIPIECKQLTLLAWVNLDSLPNPPECGGLLLSDGWNKVGFSRANFAGRIHWQIRYDGTISFTLDNRSGNMRSRPVFDNAETLGHWHHLAVVYVYGPETSHVVFYLDGEHVGGGNMIAVAHPTVVAKFGPAMIGAWWDSRDADCTCASYPLGGRIDELMIFRSALEAEEIHRIYESAKP